MIPLQQNLNPEITWNYLEPLIVEFLDDVRAQGYTDEEIRESILSPEWTEERPFAGETFHYQKSRFTLSQLVQMVELITGSCSAFKKRLAENIASLLEGGTA